MAMVIGEDGDHRLLFIVLWWQWSSLSLLRGFWQLPRSRTYRQPDHDALTASAP